MKLRSEYQKQFQHDPTSVAKYTEMLQLRQQRKVYNQYHTPITWANTSDDEQGEGNTKPIVSNILSSQCKTNVVSNIPPPKSPLKDNFSQTNVVEKKDIGVQSPNKKMNRGNFGVNFSININKQKRTTPVQLSQNKTYLNKDRDRRSSIAKNPTTQKKSKNLKSCIIQKAPFILYGWADKSSLQEKLTYNVKAPTSHIKKTALQAARLRELNNIMKLNKKQMVEVEKLKKEPLTNLYTKFNHWQTEYQREFCK